MWSPWPMNGAMRCAGGGGDSEAEYVQCDKVDKMRCRWRDWDRLKGNIGVKR